MADAHFWEALLSAALENKPIDTTVAEREKLQLLVIGSRQGVIETIRNLYHRGFAEVGAWSPLMPTPNPGEVMSILTKYLRRSS